MRYTELFIPTIKEVPSDEHKVEKQLQIRAGMERRVLQSTSIRLPLGLMQLNHVKDVVEQKLNKIDIQEIAYINSSEFSHENVVTALIRGDLKSYKSLPKTFGFGLENKYVFSFCPEDEEVEHSELIKEALDKLKLNYVQTIDQEFVATGLGNEEIILCTSCGYAQKQSVATSHKGKIEEDEMGEIGKDHTPNVGTIEDLSNFYKVDGDKFAKSLLINVDGEVIMVMIPGTKALSLTKLSKHLGVDQKCIEMADDISVNRITGAECGFAGPINLKENIKIYIDSRVINKKNLYVGANETDYHFFNVNYERDFTGEVIDCLIEVNEGDECPICRAKLSQISGMEISSTVNLGNRYLEKNYVEYLDKDGKAKRANCIRTIINIGAIVDSIVAQNNDEKGIMYQKGQGVFEAIVTIVNIKNEEQLDLANEIYNKLVLAGLNTLLDDRDERAGMKFNDAELIGFHHQITVGKLAGEKKVEYAIRGNQKATLTLDELCDILNI